ncbi:MAG: GspH/FimT family pseudopilin [Rhodocyclaceae bacterium]|nr:GspH/FimT family pseudopilin [Rhodocyclaceae bacterium]MBX3667508.1 GspH/FimT family pseudopilin [Rhodocyclaceae bacterium]
MNTMPRRSRGFTLVELMATLVVAGILVTMAVPALSNLLNNQRVKTASFDLYTALTYARSEAVKRNTDVKVAPNGTTWSSGWRVLDGSNTVLRSWSGVPSNLAVSELGNATIITYTHDGRMPVGTAQARFQIGAANSQQTVASRCIQVDLSGRPSTQSGGCS